MFIIPARCCPAGRLNVDLDKKIGQGVVKGRADGVTVEVDKTDNPSCYGKSQCRCSTSALVKVDFESLNICGKVSSFSNLSSTP